MTTLTIDMPLKLKKTHFKTALEAGYFLIGLIAKQEKNNTTQDPDRIEETQKNKKAYHDATKRRIAEQATDIIELKKNFCDV